MAKNKGSDRKSVLEKITERDESREAIGPESPSKEGIEKENQEPPAVITERTRSDPPRAPESSDIIYLSREEVYVEKQIHTLDVVLLEDPDAGPNHTGPFIERCIGRDAETKKLRVVRIPAKTRRIPPIEVVQYLGSVVQDRQAVHTASVVYPGKRRNGFTFDRFYVFNGNKVSRCCWIPNKIYQAGLLYEKMIDRKSRKAFARIRQIKGPAGKGTGEPMYRVLGAKETDYRDLKRLFERYFLRRGDEALADDIGLRILIGGQ